MVIRYLTITLLLVFVAIATIVGCGEGDGGEAPQPPVASIGNGPAFANPAGIAIGSLLVADFGLRAVVWVDPVSGEVVGSGPVAGFNRIAIEADGSFVGGNLFTLFRVNPVTGERTIVSGCTQFGGVPGNVTCIGEVIGSGPTFVGLFATAVEADGSIVVTDGGLGVVRVDPVSGDRTIISDDSTGSGPGFGILLFGITVEANGDLVVTAAAMDAVIRVNPVSGDRTIVSDANP